MRYPYFEILIGVAIIGTAIVFTLPEAAPLATLQLEEVLDNAPKLPDKLIRFQH